jgi:biopolymer transport protein TolR
MKCRRTPNGRETDFANVFSVTFLGVALVLFLVQVVATPLVCGYNGPSLSLPAAVNASIINETERDLYITIMEDGRISVGSQFVPAAGVYEELKRCAEISAERHILIRADRHVSYGVVQKVVGAISAAGFCKLLFVTFRGTVLDLLALKPAITP